MIKLFYPKAKTLEITQEKDLSSIIQNNQYNKLIK
jgi:hypothetical protein